MKPSMELRIKTMIKAVREVVLPAIDGNNSSAIEQAKLVVGSLDLLSDQISYANWFAVSDIYSHIDLLSEILGVSGVSLDESQRATLLRARTIAGRWDCTLESIEMHATYIRDLVCEILDDIYAVQDELMSNIVTNVVVKHSASQISKERAFVAKTNFDVNRQSLMSLDEVMDSNSHYIE